MKIYFDNIVFAGKNIGGISVVWYELVSRILKKHSSVLNVSFIEYPSAKNNARRKKLNIDNLPVLSQRLFPLTRYLPVCINEEEPFIFHSSYFRVCNNKKAINITTVHDFTYEKNPKVSRLPSLQRIVHSLQKKYAVKNSQYIICISENTKQDLFHFYPWVDPSRVVVINNGVSETFRVLKGAEKFTSTPFEEGTYLLYVGGRAKYKNFKLALDYVKQYDKKLVVVGAPFSEEEMTLIEEAKERIINVGRVSDEELNILYNNAFALLYPSAYEGFGIPILEAQRAGCPVIALNASSIPEVVGDVSILMHEESTKCIDQWVKRYQDADYRKEAIEKGLKNAARFSWETMADQVYELYQKALRDYPNTK